MHNNRRQRRPRGHTCVQTREPSVCATHAYLLHVSCWPRRTYARDDHDKREADRAELFRWLRDNPPGVVKHTGNWSDTYYPDVAQWREMPPGKIVFFMPTRPAV